VSMAGGKFRSGSLLGLRSLAPPTEVGYVLMV
jgi:hypothetical protein